MMSNIQLITRDLASHLNEKIEEAHTVCVLASFIMKSGVRVIKEALRNAVKNGADITICTGNYLYITQPEALKELLSIDERISIRLWKSNGTSFHPKAYLFQSNEHDVLFIGSSNLSNSALNQGIEWNISVSDEKEVFDEALKEFLDIFYFDQTVPLNKETLEEYRVNYYEYQRIHPNLVRKWTELEEQELMLPAKMNSPEKPEIVLEPPVSYGEILPRFAQIEALEE
jgi:HKD family nuclease